MTTLLISRSEAASLLDPASIVPALRDAFVAYSAGKIDRASRVEKALPAEGTAMALFPGTAPEIPAFTAKVHAKFPAQDPAIRGVLCLHDIRTGALLAVMDSTYLTAVRTGLTGALAADVLALPDADTAAVVGAGVQGEAQLRSLAALRPLARVRVYDVLDGKAQAFARKLQPELAVAVEAAASLEQAVTDTGIVLSATWSRRPFLHPGMLRAGAHVTSLGPDAPGKAEVSAELLRSARFVCDDRELAVKMGALGGVGLDRDGGVDAAELGEVLGGSRPGRVSDGDITVFGGVGLAFQDTVTAWAIYRAALESSRTCRIDFLA